MEDSFSKDALKTVLVGMDNTACPWGQSYEDRISNYGIRSGSEKKPSYVRWHIPGSVGGKRVRGVEVFVSGNYKGKFGLSHDGMKFVRTPDLKCNKKKGVDHVMRIEVPADFPEGDMFVELFNTVPGRARMCGYALLG